MTTTVHNPIAIPRMHPPTKRFWAVLTGLLLAVVALVITLVAFTNSRAPAAGHHQPAIHVTKHYTDPCHPGRPRFAC